LSIARPQPSLARNGGSAFGCFGIAGNRFISASFSLFSP